MCISIQLGEWVYITGILFLKVGITLKYLITDAYDYRQYDNVFVPDLSIIDLLMFNSMESANNLLNKFHLE